MIFAQRQRAMAMSMLYITGIGAAILVPFIGTSSVRAIDGNADVDAVFASGGRESSRVCRGEPTGMFSDGCDSISPKTKQSRAVALGFVNDDAFVDAVFAAAKTLVCLGDQHGSISDDCYRIDDASGSSAVFAVALGYIDGDDHLDAVYAVAFASNRVCLGDGGAIPRFACADLSPNTTFSTGVALGYVDGDSYLDVVVSNVFGGDPHGNQICLGNGQGAFSCSELHTSYFEAQDVSLGFVDEDDNLDAMFAGGGLVPGPDRVCLGDGSGEFACSDVDADTGGSTGVALGLVDGDEHLDAVFARYWDWGRVCLGRGDGTFDCAVVDGLRGNVKDVALGLVDGDEHIDAVFPLFSGGEDAASGNRVCLGDGAGGFSCWMGATDAPPSVGVALSPKRGTVIIEKVTEPPGPGGASRFVTTVGAEFSLSHGQEQALRSLVPNALSTTRYPYEVTETSDIEGVTLTAVSCDDAGSANPSTGDLSTRTAAIRLDPGETVTCRFTSRDERQTRPTPGEATTVPPATGTVTDFSGSAAGLTVTLYWETDIEPDVLGFNVYRSDSPVGIYRRVGKKLIRSRGRTSRGATYELEDDPGVGEFRYLLEMRHAMWSAHSGPVAIRVHGSSALLPSLASRQ